MRAAVIALIAAACGGSEQTPDGGGGSGSGSGSGSNPCPLPPSPLCSSTCGNNRIDECYFPDTSHDACFAYYKKTEACDGTLYSETCAQLGYYGGTPSCTTFCGLIASSCSVCATGPQILDCESVTSTPILTGFAASSTSLLVATGPTPALRLFTASATTLTPTVQTMISVPYGPAVGVPTGWLVASAATSSFSLRHVDTAGTAMGAVTLGQAAPFSIDLAYGPASRALVAWTEWDGNTQTSRVRTAVVDTTGAAIVAPTELLPAGTSPEGVSVATDGTSFFVASTRAGEVKRIGSDGVVASTTTGFPVGNGVRLQWSGGTGWYVTQGVGTVIAQRFDATATLTGTPIVVATEALDVIAHGNGLVALIATGAPMRKVYVQPIDSAGNTSGPIEVGIIESNAKDPRLVSLGTGVAVTWNYATRRQVALVSP